MKSAIPTSLQSGLVAGWFLDEATGTRSDIFNFSPFTDNNGVTRVAGVIDFAASFDASAPSFLSAPNNVRLTFTTQISVSCWVKYTTSAQDVPMIFGRILGASSQFFFGCSINTDDLPAPQVTSPFIFLTNSDISAVIEYGAPDSFDFTTYRHLVFIMDLSQSLAEDKMKVWLDGNQITMNVILQNGDITAFDPSTDDMTMGAIQDGNDPTDGAIDHTFVWNRLLTPYEIKRLYNNGNALRYPF